MNAVVQAVEMFPGFTTEPRITPTIRPTKTASLWLQLNEDQKTGLNNFTPNLVAELNAIVQELQQNNGVWNDAKSSHDLGYAVIHSAHPEYFSVGGDLQFFQSCIAARNAKALRAYSLKCLSLLMDWTNLLKHKMTSISLVQGRALGGGFEMALSSDVLIAEEHSSFGFPEIMFGLFPCTGAMGLLTQRVGAYQAERLMTSKKIYSAESLFEMGVIDLLCPKGKGELAVEQYISEHASRQKARLKIQQSRRRQMPLNENDCRIVVDDWVETAMQLSAEELRSLDMLILMQQGARQRGKFKLAN